jgi:hypothetical protein
VLETLSAVVRADDDAAVEWEPHITPAVLQVGWGLGGGGWLQPGDASDTSNGYFRPCVSAHSCFEVSDSLLELVLGGRAWILDVRTVCAPPQIWSANVADPLLSIDAVELLEVLASIPACLNNMQVGPNAAHAAQPDPMPSPGCSEKGGAFRGTTWGWNQTDRWMDGRTDRPTDGWTDGRTRLGADWGEA